jgi:hypothetical protein
MATLSLNGACRAALVKFWYLSAVICMALVSLTHKTDKEPVG